MFPGLRLVFDAMLQGGPATVLRELQRGLGEAAHTVFHRERGERRAGS